MSSGWEVLDTCQGSRAVGYSILTALHYENTGRTFARDPACWILVLLVIPLHNRGFGFAIKREGPHASRQSVQEVSTL